MESEGAELLNSLVSEISKGMEQVKQLKESSNSNNNGVLDKMLSSHEEALFILTGRAPQQQCHSGISSLPDPPAPATASLKRKTSMVPVSGDSSLLPDDGYSWRKYGQKHILGAKYPREYYRCSLKSSASCPARKQIQRLDDATMFKVTYRGRHVCQQSPKS
ncbi:probable WRKY transcription factor 41 [Salvia hispanica]|uniref:probable WRKY transcription factor 41 n=1 Tax=Salvia hispanica TaxID=49212 RepID=UPI002008FBC4|nr:probable WRKY transcription factor 41 [Salvia hispanica]XP_047951538.1 probable WRKY transcription factor 41 [Salvia hispanica]